MDINSKLYVSESLKPKTKQIINKIKKNKKMISLYCITNAVNDENLLEIHYYNEFFQNVYRKYYHFTLYGIAKTKQEAYELVEKMVKDCMEENGDCDLKRFLNKSSK